MDKQAPMILLKLMAWLGNHITQIDRHCFGQFIQNAKDAEGNHLLHLAGAIEATHVIKTLLEHKAAPEAVNERGQTALHSAAASNQVSVLRLLLAGQSKLSALDKQHNTALHAAAQAGASEAAVFLLEAGLSAELQNAVGQTARQLAERNRHSVTIQRFDQMLRSLKSKEEGVLKVQGALGVFLRKQQQLIGQLGNKLEEQAREIEALKKQLASKKERAREAHVQFEGERSQYELERHRKAAVKKERTRLISLQGELVKACEAGDEKRVSELLGQGVKGEVCNEQEIHPLGAAVWGMNPEVVNLVIASTKGMASLTWTECEAHNVRHYKEVFMFEAFAPQTYGEWHKLLLKMNRSPFLAAAHLVEAQKVWGYLSSFSWQKFVSWLGREGFDGAIRFNDRACGEAVVRATNACHVHLSRAIKKKVAQSQNIEHPSQIKFR